MPPLANCRIRQSQSAAAQPLLRAPARKRPKYADLGAIRAGNIRGQSQDRLHHRGRPTEGHRKKSDRDHQVAAKLEGVRLSEGKIVHRCLSAPLEAGQFPLMDSVVYDAQFGVVKIDKLGVDFDVVFLSGNTGQTIERKDVQSIKFTIAGPTTEQPAPNIRSEQYVRRYNEYWKKGGQRVQKR